MMKSIVSLIFFGCLIAFSSAHAQKVFDAPYIYLDKNDAELLATLPQYQQADLESLVDLFWILEMKEIDDLEAVDSYIQIKECDIYNDHYSDDFAWEKIRNITIEKLKNMPTTGNRRYEMIIPMPIGRYNFDEKNFPIMVDAFIKGQRRFYFNFGQTSSPVCGSYSHREIYRSQVSVQLNRPFMMSGIYMSPKDAEDFTLRQKISDLASVRIEYGEEFQRLVFVNVRLRLLKHLGQVTVPGGYIANEIYAILEGYEIYEDPNKQKLLFTTLERRKFREGGEREVIETDGPLFAPVKNKAEEGDEEADE